MLLVLAPAGSADTHRSGCLRTRIRTQLDLECYVPADGTSAAAVLNEDFGTSAFYGQLSDKPTACLYLIRWGYRT
jgi:hypothetical protein